MTSAAEKLLSDLADIQETRHDIAFRWVSDALSRVEAEARGPYQEMLERFTDFVRNADPALYDAFVFMENNRGR